MLYLLVAIICFAGSMLQGITGFGFAMVVMTFLPLFLPMKTAAVISLLMTVYTGLMMSFMLRKSLNFKIAAFPVAASFVSIPLGVHLLLSFPENILRTLLGALIMALSVFFFINIRKKIKLTPHRVNGVIAGLASGITTGMFNIGGPPLVMYYLHATADKLAYRACLEFSFAAGAVFALLNHTAKGSINVEILGYGLAGATAVTLGNLAGLKAFKKLDSAVIAKSVYSVMLILSVLIILK